MTRPPWEVAEVIRRTGDKFLERYRHSLTWAQVKVLAAIVRCRTAALGGHRDRCLRCGYQAISYNSCRNRHCPKCQTNAREKWLHQRQLAQGAPWRSRLIAALPMLAQWGCRFAPLSNWIAQSRIHRSSSACSWTET